MSHTYKIWGQKDNQQSVIVYLGANYKEALRKIREMKQEGWKFEGRATK